MLGTVLVAFLACPEDRPVRRRVEDYYQLESVKRLRTEEFKQICDGSLFQPPAQNMEECREQHRRIAIIYTVCVDVVGREPDEHGKLPPGDQAKYDECVKSFGR